ncbi:MAG: isochorismatase family protein [Candidatus Aminicenantes bacterium]|nr:isochorismatase family protein [Candidatus Aminicenantes bacterium]
MFKEPYFTKRTIAAQSKKIFDAAVINIPHRPPYLEKENTALVIIDMQKYFCSSASHAFLPASEAIIEPIKRLESRCVSLNIPVFFTRHINTKTNAGMLGTWWSDVITADNPLSVLSSEFKPEKDRIIQKTQYDAFYETDFEEKLKNQGITTIVFAGVMTNLCCETTVRSAFVRGFKPFLPVDLTATGTELFHKSTIINLAYGFAAPSLSAQIIDCLEKC